MHAGRAVLGSYLLLVWLACLLVYLGDAHDLAVGRWADQHEHLLLAIVPAAALLVLAGVAVDGGNRLHLLLVAGCALAQVVVLYALGVVLRRAGGAGVSS